MGLQRKPLFSHALPAGSPGSVYDLIARQLSVLTSQFILQDQRRQILDAYRAIGRDSLDYPRGNRPLATSTINHDGTPFQYALTLGVPSRILAFLGDVGPLDAAGDDRMDNSRRCMAYLAHSLDMPVSLQAVDELMDLLSTASDRTLREEPAGAFWIGAGFAQGHGPRQGVLLAYFQDA